MVINMKNRTVIGIICIALALVLCFGVAPLINNITDGSVEMAVIKGTVNSGAQITKDDIQSSKGKKSDFPKNSYYTYKEFVDKFCNPSSDTYEGEAYAKCEMTSGEYISFSKVSTGVVNSDSVFDGLGYDQMAVSVEVGSFANGLSGKLENGDIVSVVVATDAGGIIPEELRFVKVITTTSSGGIDKNNIGREEDGSYSETVSTVTLLVSEKQAKVLVQYSGEITFALRCRGTSASAKTYLEDQAKILEGIGG